MSAFRAAASRLLGPEPDWLAVPCRMCLAPPGQECRWRRAPGPPCVHGERRRRWDGLVDVHRAVLDAVADWTAAVAAGEPDRVLGGRARARYRALRTRADTAGWALPVLPEPSGVLASARAGAGV